MIPLHRFRLIACMLLATLPAVAAANIFRLYSEEVENGHAIASKHVFKGFGCEGGNISPVLRWHFAPYGAKSFAITMFDPDAPTGSGWWHWVVYNIPSNVDTIPSGAGASGSTSLPHGAKTGRNDFGDLSYGGPCPPIGHRPHRYIFTVHALKIERLDLPPSASAAMIGFMINQNSIGAARLIATYGRPAK